VKPTISIHLSAARRQLSITTARLVSSFSTDYSADLAVLSTGWIQQYVAVL